RPRIRLAAEQRRGALSGQFFRELAAENGILLVQLLAAEVVHQLGDDLENWPDFLGDCRRASGLAFCHGRFNLPPPEPLPLHRPCGWPMQYKCESVRMIKSPPEIAGEAVIRSPKLFLPSNANIFPAFNTKVLPSLSLT